MILEGKEPIESTIGRDKQSLLGSGPTSRSIQIAESLHLGTMLMWAESGFAMFAFDILALMRGTFEMGRVSSFYGMGKS